MAIAVGLLSAVVVKETGLDESTPAFTLNTAITPVGELGALM
jgi:hypothetical protein